MNNLLLSLKREYWEYRRMIVIVPIILSVLVMLASGAATFGKKVKSHQGVTQSQAGEVQLSVENLNESVNSSASKHTESELRQRTPIEFVGFYVGLAWLTSIIYLLSSLYADRKDKSVLYWKSLPLSETHTTFIKLVFGTVVFPLVAVAVAWIVYLLLTILGWGALKSIDSGGNWVFVERTVSTMRLFVWPLVAIAVGFVWSAPVFCYTLMVSAMSRRLPFFLLVLPPIIIGILEGILFSSSHLNGFFFGHLPFGVVGEFSQAQSLASVLHLFFIERSASLIMGLLLAAVFLATAIWCRNNRFEI